MKKSILIFLFVLLFLSGCWSQMTDFSACQAPGVTNEAAVIGWGDSIETNIAMGQFSQKSFTISAWVFPFAVYFTAMEVVGNKSGTGFSMGFANADSLAGEPQCDGLAKVYVQTDAFHRAIYCTAVSRESWHLLTVVAEKKADGVMRLGFFVDGVRLTASNGSADIELPSDYVFKSEDVLTFGRASKPAQLPAGRGGQYLGLIDEVALYSKALNEDEVVDLMSPENSLVTGFENGLFAGFRFDRGGPLPSSLAYSWAHADSKKQIERLSVSISHMSDCDREGFRSVLAKVVHRAPFSLPFEKGKPWYVIQGNDSVSGSHRDYASFSWDLGYLGDAAPGSYPIPFLTKSQPILSVVDSSIVYVHECTAEAPSFPPNVVAAQIDVGFFVSYMHMLTGSVSEVLGLTGSLKCSEKNLDIPVSRGEPIAKAGDTGVAFAGGYHLHFAATDRPDSLANNKSLITVPSFFENYEASDDLGQTWHSVAAGVPSYGQWIRH